LSVGHDLYSPKLRAAISFSNNQTPARSGLCGNKNIMSTINIAPLPVIREQIITKGGIPAEIFDYVDKAFEDESVLQSAIGVSYWYPSGYATVRDIQLSKEHSICFYMADEGGTRKSNIRVINCTGSKNAWKKPAYKGPLTLKSAQAAVAVIRTLTADLN
jgi:hypothetical protein